MIIYLLIEIDNNNKMIEPIDELLYRTKTSLDETLSYKNEIENQNIIGTIFIKPNENHNSNSLEEQEEITKCLNEIKAIFKENDVGLSQSPSTPPSSSSSSSSSFAITNMINIKPLNLEQFAEKLCDSEDGVLLLKIVEALELLPINARKTVSYLFNYILRRNWGKPPLVSILGPAGQYSHLIQQFIKGYEIQEPHMALYYGSMFRECIRYHTLMEGVLESESVWNLLGYYIQITSFDILSDALNSLRALLLPGNGNNHNNSGTTGINNNSSYGQIDYTSHKTSVSKFLQNNFDRFLGCYEALMLCENYVTRRSSLKLLGELLVQPVNQKTLIKYVNQCHQLKVIMLLLKDRSSNIQLEAFHIFKLFVMNPRQPYDIRRIMVKNREKLSLYLMAFRGRMGDSIYSDCDKLLEFFGNLASDVEDVEEDDKVGQGNNIRSNSNEDEDEDESS